jgi:hypothetical protein
MQKSDMGIDENVVPSSHNSDFARELEDGGRAARVGHGPSTLDGMFSLEQAAALGTSQELDLNLVTLARQDVTMPKDEVRVMSCILRVEALAD